MNKPIRFAIGFFVLLSFHSVALANPLTPVFLTQGIHLYVGNAIIGVLEGLLIAWIFKVPRRRSIGFMIGANYVSMLGGIIVLGLCGYFAAGLFFLEPELYMIHYFRFIFVPLFLFAIVLEWPFCSWIMPSCKGRWRKGIKASLLAQAISYALFIPLYVFLSTTPESGGTEIDRNLVHQNKDPASIYFLGTEDDDLYRIKLNGTGLEKLQPLDVKHARNIYTAPNETNTGWTLYIKSKFGDQPVPLIKDFAQRPAIAGYVARNMGGYWENMHGHFMPPAELRPKAQRDWEVRVSILAHEALVAKSQKTGEVL